MQDTMSTADKDILNTLLETIAQLIEAKALTVKDAAKIVRGAKTQAK